MLKLRELVSGFYVSMRRTMVHRIQYARIQFNSSATDAQRIYPSATSNNQVEPSKIRATVFACSSSGRT